MLADSIRNMKLDRRLTHRRGWVDEAELQAALEALPDVTDKGSYAEDEESAGGASGASEPAGS